MPKVADLVTLSTELAVCALWRWWGITVCRFPPDPSKKSSTENSTSSISSIMQSTPAHFVRIRVGGEEFEASEDTLLNFPGSVFEALLSARWRMQVDCPNEAQSQALLFDRDPKRFRVLLNFMRSGELVLEDGVSAQGIRQEADFFQLGAAAEAAEALLAKEEGAALLHVAVDPRRGKLARLDATKGEATVLSSTPVSLGRDALVAVTVHIGGSKNARLYVQVQSMGGGLHQLAEHVGDDGRTVRAVGRIPAGRHVVEVCGELETSTDGTDGTLANSPHRKHGVVWGPSRVEVWRYPYEAGVASWAESLDTTRPCELAPGNLKEWSGGGAPFDAQGRTQTKLGVFVFFSASSPRPPSSIMTMQGVPAKSVRIRVGGEEFEELGAMVEALSGAVYF